MELRYQREAAVGFLLILGAVAFVALMTWLRGQSFRSGDVVSVTFDDVAGLKVGDPVRTSGVAVGRVTLIRLVSPGNVAVEFDLGDSPPPREDASARILSADLFGARYVEYFPGVARTPLPAGRPLRGIRVQDMAEMAAAIGDRGKALIDTLSATTTAVSRELRVALENTNRLLGTLNEGADGSTQRLGAALDELRRVLQRVDVLVAQNGPTATEAVRSMRDAAAHADSMSLTLARASARLDSTLMLINHGAGPVGSALNDTTIVRELMATNTALRELLLDFKANPSRYIRFRL